MPKKYLFLIISFSTHSFLYAQSRGLAEIVKMAEANSPYLEAKNLQIQASGALVDQARLWGNPTISGDLGGITQNDISGLSYSITVSQPIFFPGKQKLRAAFAAYTRDTENLSLIERKQLIQFNVIQAAYRHKLTEDLLAQFKVRLNRFRMLRTAIAAKPIVSPEIKAQKLIIENALRNAERDYLNFQKDLVIATETLKTYIGNVENHDLALPLFYEPTQLDLDAILEAALANNILVKKIEIEALKAETNSSLLSREAYPDISVDAYYSKDTGPFQEHRFGGGVSFPLPIFNRNQHAVTAANQYTVAAKKEREYAVGILRRDTAAAFEDYRLGVEMIRKFPVSEVDSTNKSLAHLTSEFVRSRLTTLTFAEVEKRMTDQIASSFMAQMAYVNALLQLSLLEGSDDLTRHLLAAGRK